VLKIGKRHAFERPKNPVLVHRFERDCHVPKSAR
jgi:hypothetical protein